MDELMRLAAAGASDDAWWSWKARFREVAEVGSAINLKFLPAM